MIGWLRGRVVSRIADAELILDVGGVGYRVYVPTSVIARAGNPGDELELHVHTHVREDAISLYGFETAEHRRCFEALLSAHGVGPSLAMAVMSVLTPADLVRAVMEEDLAVLCDVPGVGRKTAARLVIDLRSRLVLPDLAPSEIPGTRGPSSARADVRSALAELGYGPEEIRRALDNVDSEEPVEEQLRRALRELAGAR